MRIIIYLYLIFLIMSGCSQSRWEHYDTYSSLQKNSKVYPYKNTFQGVEWERWYCGSSVQPTIFPEHSTAIALLDSLEVTYKGRIYKKDDVSNSLHIDHYSLDDSGMLWATGTIHKLDYSKRILELHVCVTKFRDNKWDVVGISNIMPTSLSLCRKLLVDDSGSVWLDYGNKGLLVMNSSNGTFKYFAQPIAEKKPMTTIEEISDPRHAGHLDYINGIFHRNYDPYGLFADPVPQTCESLLSTNCINSIFKDHDGIIWISSKNEIIRVVDGTWEIVEFPFKGKSLPCALASRANGDVLFCSFKSTPQIYDSLFSLNITPSGSFDSLKSQGVYRINSQNKWEELSYSPEGLIWHSVSRAYSQNDTLYFVYCGGSGFYEWALSIYTPKDKWGFVLLDTIPLRASYNNEKSVNSSKARDMHNDIFTPSKSLWSTIAPTDSELFSGNQLFSQIIFSNMKDSVVYAAFPKRYPRQWILAVYKEGKWSKINSPSTEFAENSKGIPRLYQSEDNSLFVSTPHYGVFRYFPN